MDYENIEVSEDRGLVGRVALAILCIIVAVAFAFNVFIGSRLIEVSDNNTDRFRELNELVVEVNESVDDLLSQSRCFIDLIALPESARIELLAQNIENLCGGVFVIDMTNSEETEPSEEPPGPFSETR